MGWISYITFTLVEGSSTPPTPENTFSEKDDTIIVVHNYLEIDYNNSIVSSLQKNSFYSILLNEPERIQHFYFSTNRELVLLERSKPWTSELVKKYFETLSISSTISTQKHLSLSNNWKGEFHGKYLIIYLNEWTPTEKSIVSWKYLDRKSSLSLVYKTADQTYEIEDSYYISSNHAKYITHTGSKALPLINDQEIFQELIPADFHSYTFFEKNYLKTKYPKKSILDEWMNYGLALVSNQNDTCLITDYKPGQDPLAILSELNNVDISTKQKQATLKGHYFPFLHSTKKVYIEIFNNNVLISNSQQSINRLIGAYETGGNLEQSTTLKYKLFSNSPQKVSYRNFDHNQQLTMSRLTHANHSTLQVYTENSSHADTDSKELPKLNPLRLDDNLISLNPIPNSNFLVAITRSNMLYFIGSKQILWSKNLESDPIGNPVFIGNGVFLTTKNGIIGLDRAGNNLGGFPISSNEVTSNLFSYYWNKKDYIAFVSDGQLQGYSTDGKLSYKIGIGGNLQKNAQLVIQGKKGDLIAHICTESTWSSISVKRKKTLKTTSLNEGEWNLVKVNGTVSLLGLVKKQFVRITENGTKAMLIGNVSSILSSQTLGEERIFFLTQQNIIYVINGSGIILGQFNSTITSIDDASIIKLSTNKIIVGIIDGIANNCYIYTINGNELNKENLEGSNKIMFQKQTDGTVLLVSQANGYLIRYPLNY
ncbi:hypothetical protein [Fluviicola taffensis]|uniref:Uncharacterized protein n=1 Tax=Fluviicola taffensis (strain DSM 16823 / NCIMB 13979 / RW262) TaxID=755732 RepID=F2IC85_FLUTR|nr:hypothetical protein [Fluviicola taffensis]AEA44331.1 hypothetical protein Fluta_2345 [Fluviicola taffensis DSM 16823]